MKVYSRITGESFESTPEDKHEQRLARLRNRVYWGVLNVSRETQYLGGRVGMLTLTYRPGKHWSPKHISEFIKEYRKENDSAYVWVGELQKRGALHYHYLTRFPEGYKWSKSHIDTLWYFGLTWVTDEVKKPNYLLKYLSKEYQKNGNRYPKACRIVGYSRPTHYISNRENHYRVASRYPRWLSGGMDEEEREEIGRTGSRVRGGVIVGGRVAISPYSTHELPSQDKVAESMRFAFLGELPYD